MPDSRPLGRSERRRLANEIRDLRLKLAENKAILRALLRTVGVDGEHTPRGHSDG